MEEEGKVGQFSSLVFKNNENYIVTYLNLLIHGILTATKEFEKYVKELLVDEDKAVGKSKKEEIKLSEIAQKREQFLKQEDTKD